MPPLPLAVPPSGTAEVHPEIRAAADHYLKWFEENAQAQLRVYDLELGRHAAEADDAQATADALRAGKKDPGQRHLRKLLDDIAEATRLATAKERAMLDARSELEQAVNQHGSDQFKNVAAAIAKQRKKVAAAVEQIADAHGHLAELLTLQAWTTSMAEGGKVTWNPAAFATTVANTRGRNGEPLHITAVLEGLRDLAAGPPARPAPADEPDVDMVEVLETVAEKRGVPVGALTSESAGPLIDEAGLASNGGRARPGYGPGGIA